MARFQNGSSLMAAPAAQDAANDRADLVLPDAAPEVIPGETNAGVAADHAVEPSTDGRPEIETEANASDHATVVPFATAPAAESVASETAALDLPDAVAGIVPGETDAGAPEEHSAEASMADMPETETEANASDETPEVPLAKAPPAEDVADEMAGLDLPDAVPEIVPGETNAGRSEDHAVEPPVGGRPEVEAATTASDHAPEAPFSKAPPTDDVADEMAGLELPDAVPEIVPGETNAGRSEDHAVEPPTEGMPDWLPMIIAEHVPEDLEDEAEDGGDLLDMLF